MRISEISVILDATLYGQDVVIENLTTDSKNVKPGDLYIARKGASLDGHDFVAEAQAKGAAAAMVERRLALEFPQIVVSNSTEALGMLGAWKRRNFNHPVLAITGSCGKTTTKEMLAAILRECGAVFVNIKSFNNAVGLPLTLWHLKPEHDYAVVEIGANHHGEISALMQLIQPVHVAAITNAEACHLEGFGDIAGVAKAKAEIFTGLNADGVAVLNRDSDYFDYWLSAIGSRNHLSFGMHSNADVTAEKIDCSLTAAMQFVLQTPQGAIAITLPHLGKHNIMNALTAAAAALAIGAPLTAIQRGLAHSAPQNMRLVVRPGYNDARIIDDTYNANPKAVAAALEVLLQQSGEKIFVFGGMRELGSEAAKWHYYIGQLAKTMGVKELFVWGQFATDVAQGFGKAAKVFTTQDELTVAVRSILDNTKVVLVKGSRGAEMENVVRQLIKN